MTCQSECRQCPATRCQTARVRISDFDKWPSSASHFHLAPWATLPMLSARLPRCHGATVQCPSQFSTHSLPGHDPPPHSVLLSLLPEVWNLCAVDNSRGPLRLPTNGGQGKVVFGLFPGADVTWGWELSTMVGRSRLQKQGEASRSTLWTLRT